MAEAMVIGAEREDLDPRRMRPPDKKKFEEDLDLLNTEIKAKDSHIKSLSPRGDDSIQHKLREIRGEKDVLIQRRKSLDMGLKVINQDVTKRRENLARIETGLQYKNEDKINEAIRRLENQLKRTNYQLKEEKRIVGEIDRLKRSKKSLVQYNGEKRQLDGLIEQQKAIREEMEWCFRQVASMKKSEEQLKRDNQESRKKSDVIKKELDELYERKRSLTTDYRKREREYNEFRNELRRKKQDEFRQRKEDEKMKQEQMYQQELAEYEASREPYEDEKQLCRTLTSYLQRYLVEGSTEPAVQDSENHEHTDITEPEGMRVLKKKDDLELFGGVRPKVGKKKKDRKKSVNKVVHTPEVLAQFVQIGLLAPSSVNDVPAAICQLADRLDYYNNLPPPQIVTSPEEDATGADQSEGSAAPSVGDSAISDSIPTTPEVLENGMPRFDTRGQDAAWPRPRRVSLDSGSELEEKEDKNDLAPKVKVISLTSLGLDTDSMGSESQEQLHSDDLHPAIMEQNISIQLSQAS